MRRYNHLTPPPIIVDTSVLVSLATDTEQNHACAIEEAAKLGAVPIILPSDVLAETINILGKKSGHETACKAAEQLLHPDSQFVLIKITAYVQAALTKFVNQPEGVSYTAWDSYPWPQPQSRRCCS